MSAWELFSSHGLVLIYFSRHPRARLRDAAEAIGLTERAVQNNIRDLAASGHLLIEKVGRRNRYRVVGRKHLTHPTTRSVSLRQLLQLFKLNEREDSALVMPVIKAVAKKHKPPLVSEDKPKAVAEPAWNTAKQAAAVVKDEINPAAIPEVQAEVKPAVEIPDKKGKTQQVEVAPLPSVTDKQTAKPKKPKAEKNDDLPQQDLLF